MYCLSPADKPSAVRFSGLNGQVVGSGPIGVVLTNGSANDSCLYRPLVDRLRAVPMFRTLLYFFQGKLENNIAAAAKFMRGQGCRTVLLVGDSVGGSTTLIVASALIPVPAGAVSLSGESTPDEVHYLRVPTLILASESDRLFPGPTARQVFAVIPATDKQLKVFDGAQHGTALLEGPQAAEALDLVVGFLQAHAQ